MNKLSSLLLKLLLAVVLHDHIGNAEVQEAPREFLAIPEQSLQHPHQILLPLLAVDEVLILANQGKSLRKLLLSVLFCHFLGELLEIAGIHVEIIY